MHLYPSPLTHEMRMEKIARSIFEFGHFSRIELIGIQAAGLPVLEAKESFVVCRVSRRHFGGPRFARKLVQTIDWTWQVFQRLRKVDVRCVNSHSLAVLPLGVLLKVWHKSRLVYDTHEFETEVSTARGITRWVYKALERLFIGRADAVVVVGDFIADWYANRYGIERPLVVRNVPSLSADGPPKADPTLWRSKFGIPDAHVIFIYQGGLFQGRRIEQFLRVFARSKDDRHILFMGYGELEGRVREMAAQHNNIHFAPAVSPSQVLRHTAGADVGLVGVENACLSYYYSLPNKLFEFISAGIPSLMPKFPEMMRLAKGAGFGWGVGELDEDWLAAVNELSQARIEEGKRAACGAASSLSWQNETAKLQDLYSQPVGVGST